jgi:hypothetical protein
MAPSSSREEDALAEMRPSQQNGQGFTSREGTPPSSPAKFGSNDGSREGTPKAKRGSKAGEASRVRVFVRVRPAVRKNELEAAEGDKGSTSAIHCQGPKLWLLDTSEDGGEREAKKGTRQFVFDGSLPPDSTQQDVFRTTCEETGVGQQALPPPHTCTRAEPPFPTPPPTKPCTDPMPTGWPC